MWGVKINQKNKKIELQVIEMKKKYSNSPKNQQLKAEKTTTRQGAARLDD